MSCNSDWKKSSLDQPQEISNSFANLVRSPGGQPGFINISRYMCVNDSRSGIQEGGSFPGGTAPEDLPAKTNSLLGVSWSCGNYHSRVEKSYSAKNNRDCSATDMYHAITVSGCSDCSSAPGLPPYTGCGGNGGGTIHDYISRDTNSTTRARFSNRIAFIPGGLHFNSDGKDAYKICAPLIFKHPRMNIDELKYFGVPANKRSDVVSVSSGEVITFTDWGCISDMKGTVSVIFLKKDLSQIVIGTNKTTTSTGVELHNFKIASKIIAPTFDIDDYNNVPGHSLEALSWYTFHVSFWNNGGNKGNQPIGFVGAQPQIQIPNAPFWDDDTVMVVLQGPNSDGGGKQKSRTSISITNNGSSNWFNGPHHVSGYFRYSQCAPQIGCRISYRIDEYTETFFGCSQLKDFDYDLSSSGLPIQQTNNKPESGSHIMKLVSNDYYERNCTERINTLLVAEQDSVPFASNCYQDIGDPRIDNPYSNPAIPRTGCSSYNGHHYLEKCTSYSMNVNPQNVHESYHRCCSPKISGPFLLETSNTKYRSLTGTVPGLGINEKLYDIPFAKDNPFGNLPDLSLFNAHFTYLLSKRIDCDCKGLECALPKCYGCPTSTKEQYDFCISKQTCRDGNCCTNPCLNAPKNYRECLASPYGALGCCEECPATCIVANSSLYSKCLNGEVNSSATPPYDFSNCPDGGCCDVCSYCSGLTFENCSNDPVCVAQNCCSVSEEDCNQITKITELFDCLTSRHARAPLFGNTKYKNSYNSACCKSNNCGMKRTIQPPTPPPPAPPEAPDKEDPCTYFFDYTYDQCVANTQCKAAECYLLKKNPNYPPAPPPPTSPPICQGCVTSTVEDYVSCLADLTPTGASPTGCGNKGSTTQKCCSWPCDTGVSNNTNCNYCIANTLISEIIDDGSGGTVTIQRPIATYSECVSKCSSCVSTGCCKFYFKSTYPGNTGHESEDCITCPTCSNCCSLKHIP